MAWPPGGKALQFRIGTFLLNIFPHELDKVRMADLVVRLGKVRLLGQGT